jgi:hypothetical protein
MQKLEQERGKGRDDYPIRAVWNSLLAGIVYLHPSIESLRRELGRNGQLREICGFDLCLVERAVPPAYVYIRFCRKLMHHIDEVEGVFSRLEPDGHRDTDADFGKKVYQGRREGVTLWEKVVVWFGYKLHLIVDAIYELPVDFKVTKASCNDMKKGPELVDSTGKTISGNHCRL